MALRAGAGAQTAFALGSATSTGGRLAQFAGGMQGVLQAGAGAARSMVTSRTGPAMQQLRQTLQAGHRAGFVNSGGTLPATMTARQAPVIARPGPSFGTQLRQTLQSSAYYFGHNQGHGGVTPHF
jgi:type IV secretion system protein TrbL